MEEVTNEILENVNTITTLSKQKNKLNRKQEDGITLVALVVTLVILLILAGITIATLFGDNGVINKVQKAKEETDRTSQEEQEGLNKTEKDMANAIKGNKEIVVNEWTQPDPLKPEITNGEITLKIGDYVDYNCKSSKAEYKSPKEKSGHDKDQIFKASEYQYGWRVLGVDKKTKQLQLISEDFVPLTGGGDRGNRKGQYYYLTGQNGYINGVDELNNISSIYGKGEGAVGARMVNVDDINWITGYNPNNTGHKDPSKTGNGTKCYVSKIYEYGNSVEYRISGGKVEYRSGSGSFTTSKYTKFTYYDEVSKEWQDLGTSGNVTLKSSVYLYYPTTLTETNDINATTGIAVTSEPYKMLFTNSGTGADTINAGKTDNYIYWLGSSCVDIGTGIAYFGVRYVNSGYVLYNYLYYSNDDVYVPYCAIRPVVTLSSKVQLKDSGTMQDGCKLYNMEVK